MNIFVLDKKPHVAVQMLCDCHVRKMCLETAQILSGVMFRKGLKLSDNMPKPQSINHPVIAAVAEDKDDAIAWVLDYNQELQTEFCRRFGKHHLYTDLVYNYVSELWDWSEGGIGGLAKCCGDLDVADMDIVTAYRKYYTEVKKPQLQAKGLWKFTKRKDWTE